MTNKGKGQAPPWKDKKKDKDKARRVEKAAQKQTEVQETPQPVRSVAHEHLWPAAKQTYHGEGDYHFLNPYNFVRYLPQPKVAADQPDTILLGRCSPPPHDRYLGLSGSISCQLEAVTPLFIADSHGVQSDPVSDGQRRQQGSKCGKLLEHNTYRFFQIDGKDVIPATSVRGAIRSLYETITNSCFSVFDAERILEYRAEPSYGNKLKQNGGLVTKLAQPDSDGEIRLCHIGTVGFYYKLSDKKQNAIGIENNHWQTGEYVAACVRQRDKGGWQVLEIAKQKDDLSLCKSDDNGELRQKHVEGWLYITGKGEDTNKKNETFIIDPDKYGDRGTISFDYDIQVEYNRIRQSQFEQDELPLPLHSPKLNENDFVWADIDGEGSNRKVNRLSRVQVPRLPHVKAIGELLPDHLHPCKEYESLCPACRLFGWVKDAHQAGERDWQLQTRTAYAGRLHFSHANLIEDKGCYKDEMSLVILSSPKPTTELFYLYKGQPEGTEFQVPDGERTIAYKEGYKLRGRKFYHHHGKLLNRQEFERAEKIHDHQNRTVKGVRAPGNLFSFTIDFHNLAPVELGALLWVLQLNMKGCHLRLGYGKPLGFGSVALTLEEKNGLILEDHSKRYQTCLAGSGRSRATFEQRSNWITRFDKAMQFCYGTQLHDLPNIQDLFILLREPTNQMAQRIHYPRPSKETDNHRPDPEGKQFEWFVGNKAGGKKEGGKKGGGKTKQGPYRALEKPSTAMTGLPLIDADGKIFGESK